MLLSFLLNLGEYPEDSPLVVVDYRESSSNKDPDSTAINDMEEETGTETGQCPFVLHGLTGEEYFHKISPDQNSHSG